MDIFYSIRLQLSYTSVNHLSFLPFKKNLGKMADSLKLHVFMYLISIIKTHYQIITIFPLQTSLL